MFNGKLNLALLAFSVTLFGMLFFGHAKASALWCDVMANPARPNGTAAANCQAGQDETALYGVSTSKASLESYLNGKLSSGYGFQKTGARYIINGLGGSDWETRLSNPAVTVAVASYSSCTNTAYDPSSSSVVSYSDCITASSFLVKYNGTIVYAIKRDCGNPLGNLSGPPPYNPDSPPTGSVTVSCNADGTGEIRSSFSDPDGATTATVTYSGSSGTIARSLPNATYNPWDISATAADPSWSARLVVQDRGGSDDRTYTDSSGSCNKIPVGSLTNVSCNTVKMTPYDPNTPNSNIAYYLSIGSAGAKTGYTGGGKDAGAISRSVSGLAGFNDWSTNAVYLYAKDVQTGTVYQLDSTTLPVCGQVACGRSSLAALPIGIATPFHVSMTYSGASGPPPGATFTIKVAGPNSQTYPGVAGGASGSTITSKPDSMFTANNPGSYVVTWTYYGKSCPTSASPINAAFQPYFSVSGSDVSAGPDFSAPGGSGAHGSCSTNTSADISGLNLGSSAGYFGAGSQLGALATGSITSFATAITTAAAANLASNTGTSTLVPATINPVALAFANTTGTPTGPTYGGSFGRTSWCVPSYTSAASTPTGAPNYSVSGTYTLPGGSTIPATTIPAGKHVTVIVHGDVFLSGDITYGSYTSLSDIPQFQLLVSGNIYIYSAKAPATPVKTLEGFYDAQPNTSGGGGTIYTCATALGAQVDKNSDPATAYDNCNNPLTFYGGVAAEQIKLERTSGNLKTSGATVKDTPAEQFVYTPELWLGDLTGPNDGCSTDPSEAGCTYQAYTSLPPIL